MSIQLASTFDQALSDILPMSELVGMKADVEAARQLLKTVETADDLYTIYRTDVPAGSMSIRNLLAVLLERMNEISCRSSYAIERIKMTLGSSHVESLHKVMKDKKKGDTTVNLYQPTYTAYDLDKAMNEFKDIMGDNVKPKYDYALKKGKVCFPILNLCLFSTFNNLPTFLDKLFDKLFEKLSGTPLHSPPWNLQTCHLEQQEELLRAADCQCQGPCKDHEAYLDPFIFSVIVKNKFLLF